MNRKTLAQGLVLITLIAMALAGCSAFGGSTPEALPTVVLDSGAVDTGTASTGNTASTGANTGGVIASGVVVPAQEAQLAFALSGALESVEVAIGERVEAGQVLARLAGAEQLQAALSAAELEVMVAQQALQTLSDDLPEEQAAALQAYTEARDAVRDAQRVINGFDVASEPIDIQVASSNLALAERALEQAKKDFKPYEKKPESNFKRAALLSKLSDAQKRYDNSLKQYNRLTGVIVPEFDYQQAQYELEIANARLELAQDKLELLKDGPDPAELSLAVARVETAQDRADAARASLLNLELKAPFSGTVSKVNFQGQEWVTPGQTVVELLDLDRLRVETIDLSERDIPKIQVGQPVSVFIDALNQNVPGKVILIAPTAETLGGDVVYKTTIDLDTPPPDLRSGMSVEVSFGAEP